MRIILSAAAAVVALAFASPVGADPANPDPFSPADCTANASAACDVGPYGPDSLTNPANINSPLNPDNPANPDSPMNPDNPANINSPLNPANPMNMP